MESSSMLNFICFFAVVTLVVCSTEEASPVVSTPSGSLRGRSKAISGGFTVHQFLGIPFAQPPVGRLRFARPEPVKPWEGVREAIDFGPICPQLSFFQSLGLNASELGMEPVIFPQDEDCLNLNVYTPSTKPSNAAVMVWIHGGGFTIGAARTYDVSHMVAFHDVIVVTINYRLGVLGFLNIPGTDIKGNFGIHDQILALKWVQANIASFGGNPDRVTIFGESAGGMSVSGHLLSPLSKGLFHRAIVQSGSSLTPYSAVKVENSLSADAFSKFMDCDGKNVVLVECFRGKSVENLLAGQANISAQIHIRNYLTTIVVDGEFMPEDPEILLNEGKVNKADVITGFTGNEGGFVALLMFKNTSFTAESFRSNLQIGFKMLGIPKAPIWESAVFQEYFPHDDRDDAIKIRQAVMDYSSDQIFVAPAIQEAKLFTKAGNRVFMYVFDHCAHIPRHAAWLGAHHGLDLVYSFGLPIGAESFQDDFQYFLPGNFSALEKGFTMYIIELWANFAKYGDPNGNGHVPVSWPAYNNTEHAHLSISTNPKVGFKYRERKAAFWNQFVPVISGSNSKTEENTVGEKHKDEL